MKSVLNKPAVWMVVMLVPGGFRGSVDSSDTIVPLDLRKYHQRIPAKAKTRTRTGMTMGKTDIDSGPCLVVAKVPQVSSLSSHAVPTQSSFPSHS